MTNPPTLTPAAVRRERNYIVDKFAKDYRKDELAKLNKPLVKAIAEGQCSDAVEACRAALGMDPLPVNERIGGNGDRIVITGPTSVEVFGRGGAGTLMPSEAKGATLEQFLENERRAETEA